MTDPLTREPDFDFQAYRAWCETANLKVRWAELDFLRWLYSDLNGRM